jgi:hypothetical protein
MIQRESHFQYLLALAVAGQVSETEMAELMEHKANCSSCSQRMVEMESVNLQMFVTLAAQVKKTRVSSRMQERFLVRAAHSGVRMAAPSSGFRHSYFLHFAALLLAVCLFSGLSWRQVMQSPLRRTLDSTTSVKTATAPKLSAMADIDMVLLEAPSVRRSANGPPHPKHPAPGKTSSLPAFAMAEDSRVATPAQFRLDPAFFSNQSKAIKTEAKLRSLEDLPIGHLGTRGAGLETSFFTPAISNPTTSGALDQRVFHYRATLASVSLQDDQAVFGLNPRVREFLLSEPLDSTRFR